MYLSRPSLCLVRHTLLSIRHQPRLILRRGHATSGSSAWTREDEAISSAKGKIDKKRAPKNARPASDPKPASGLSKLKAKRTVKGHEFVLGHSTDMPIRARFAPSPTGSLHLGSIRTALYNKLAALATKGGAFILRIEDTDQARLVPGAEEDLKKDLKWAGLTWDEGPDVGGPYGPYRQSERLGIYHEHASQLIRDGSAYRCFCSKETLDAAWTEANRKGQTTVYPGTCRGIHPEESDKRAASGEPYVVRINEQKFGRNDNYDAIQGLNEGDGIETDFILIKRDGYPTYHLANVVDDHLMKITHVIRGEEWLISTKRHLMLYKAFGWTPPIFAHLGLLADPSGYKLSKRNKSAGLDLYKSDAILPIPLLNWLATLGGHFKPNIPVIRTLKAMSNYFQFKFTRGFIKLNMAKLAHMQRRYGTALAMEPRKDLAQIESKHIDECLVEPTVAMVDKLTETHDHLAQWSHEAWHEPLVPIPAFVADPQRRRKSIRDLLLDPERGYKDPRTLLFRAPAFFWRVPRRSYEESIVERQPNEDVFRALEKAVQDATLWQLDGEDVIDMIRILMGEGVEIKSSDIHDCVRFVAVGAWKTEAPHSRKIFTVLPREEWMHRVEVVREVLAQYHANSSQAEQSAGQSAP